MVTYLSKILNSKSDPKFISGLNKFQRNIANLTMQILKVKMLGEQIIIQIERFLVLSFWLVQNLFLVLRKIPHEPMADKWE